MEEIKKIVGNNLLIMLGYCFLFALGGEYLGIFIVMIIHFTSVIILTFSHLLKEEYVKRKAYLLTSGVILLIGFSTCYGFLNRF